MWGDQFSTLAELSLKSDLDFAPALDPPFLMNLTCLTALIGLAYDQAGLMKFFYSRKV